MTNLSRRQTLGTLAALLAIAITASLGGAEQPKPKSPSVEITANGFKPARITIKAGDSVTWTNTDARDHTVTGAKGAFSSGNIKPKGKFSFRFPKAGTFAYSCSLHPRMKGTVIVQP